MKFNKVDVDKENASEMIPMPTEACCFTSDVFALYLHLPTYMHVHSTSYKEDSFKHFVRGAKDS